MMNQSQFSNLLFNIYLVSILVSYILTFYLYHKYSTKGLIYGMIFCLILTVGLLLAAKFTKADLYPNDFTKIFGVSYEVFFVWLVLFIAFIFIGRTFSNAYGLDKHMSMYYIPLMLLGVSLVSSVSIRPFLR